MTRAGIHGSLEGDMDMNDEAAAADDWPRNAGRVRGTECESNRMSCLVGGWRVSASAITRRERW
jgi:hypothetical protein